MPKFNKWDIWYALVPFDDGGGGKIRPVIITEGGVLVIKAAPVYSSPSQNGVYELEHWSNAGLNNPSCVSISEVDIPVADFRVRIGRLFIADLRKLEQLLIASKEIPEQ